MKIAIFGYGNLGRGVEYAARQNKDAELIGVFTRRNPRTVRTETGVPVYPAKEVFLFKEKIDVLISCCGSAVDLPETTPALAEQFNVIDSFDTHAEIARHFEAVDRAAKKGKKTALISAGWDPGLFSLVRLYSAVSLPEGTTYTFWGKGVSQGHSDAIRQISGVRDARQYTVPVPEALDALRSGQTPAFTPRQMHRRECYVATGPEADQTEIERQIKEMPHYFVDYDTTVTFVSEEELQKNHANLPHGGVVFRSGATGRQGEHRQTVEYRLHLDSNPEFTGSVLIAFARGVYRMHGRGDTGCKTVLDVAPADLSPLSGEELRKQVL